MLDLKKNYVCVMDMGFFQLSLRMSDGKDPKYPRIDLQATNNLLNIRTCVDSCDALRKLIIYFANDGDLNPPSPSPVPAQQSEESIPSSSSTSTKATQPQSPAVSTSPIAQGHFEQMQNLMEEAMKEYSSTTSESSGSNKGSPPTVINISSDKDEKPPTEMFLFPDESKTTKQSRSQQSAKAESDDDFDDDDVFCILDVPGMGIMVSIYRTGEPPFEYFLFCLSMLSLLVDCHVLSYIQ
uniref:Autophagy-related protein 2 n=1 Tax=Saccoglossus kowalevskii TaxID=10224 RepID=A0ABM0MBZ1_SACKO|nr:PREDICTED: autophagy-related protein 2 homolog A-like [Saccoglossus kowalevskii]